MMTYLLFLCEKLLLISYMATPCNTTESVGKKAIHLECNFVASQRGGYWMQWLHQINGLYLLTNRPIALPVHSIQIMQYSCAWNTCLPLGFHYTHFAYSFMLDHTAVVIPSAAMPLKFSYWPTKLFLFATSKFQTHSTSDVKLVKWNFPSFGLTHNKAFSVTFQPVEGWTNVKENFKYQLLLLWKTLRVSTGD